jgi:hypothetical protein
MAAGVGQLIESSDYASIKSKVDLIFGTGAGDSGYGQTVTSPSVSTGSQITAAQWLALRTDMVKARQHQTGVSVGTSNAVDGQNLLLPSSGAAITEALRNQFNSFSNTITASKFAVAASQLSNETLITGTRTTSWNSTLTHIVTITGNTDGLGAAANMRYFFNAGGQIRVAASRNGGTSSSKNTTWGLMFSQMGEFVMDYTQTSYTGSSATGSTVGWFDLTTSNQLVGQKDAPSGSYAENRYYIYARRSSDSSQLILTIVFEDNDAGDPNIDENPDGTLISQVSQYRPSGSNVTVGSPSASQSGL